MCQILSFGKKQKNKTTRNKNSFIYSFIHSITPYNTSSSKSLQVIDFIDGINIKKQPQHS